jgi:hypothetical protein
VDAAHWSKVSRRRFILRSASANRFRKPPEKSARPSRIADSRPDDLDADRRERVEVERVRSGVPTSCGDGSRRARVRSSISS